MSNPIPTPTAVREPQLPAITTPTIPSFTPGVVTTGFWYTDTVTGATAHGTRVVSTDTQGAQTVQVLGATGSALVTGTYAVVPAPSAVAVAGGSTVGGGGTTNGITDAQLRATPVSITGAVTTGGLTDAQLRATPVPISTAVTVRTAALTSVTAAGTVAAGAYEVGFSNEGTTAATVAGGSLLPGRSVSFVTHGNDTLAAISYTASATSALTIATVR